MTLFEALGKCSTSLDCYDYWERLHIIQRLDMMAEVYSDAAMQAMLRDNGNADTKHAEALYSALLQAHFVPQP